VTGATSPSTVVTGATSASTGWLVAGTVLVIAGVAVCSRARA
jgi:hypothetical protein